MTEICTTIALIALGFFVGLLFGCIAAHTEKALPKCHRHMRMTVYVDVCVNDTSHVSKPDSFCTLFAPDTAAVIAENRVGHRFFVSVPMRVCAHPQENDRAFP